MGLNDIREDHLWWMFDRLSGRRFRKFSGVNMELYRRMKQYQEGKLCYRPASRDKLLKIRKTLLDALDAYEQAHGGDLLV